MAARFTGNALKSAGESRCGSGEGGAEREVRNGEEFGSAEICRGMGEIWEGKAASLRRTDD
jgi:hypothetical protein